MIIEVLITRKNNFSSFLVKDSIIHVNPFKCWQQKRPQLTRSVPFIQTFSFDLVHKPGKTFTMPDGLSRRPIGEDDEEYGQEVEEFDEDEPGIKPVLSAMEGKK